MKFKNKVCVITGAANGIGRCIAKEFAMKGSKVALIDLDKEAGEKTLSDIKKNGGEGLFLCGDIADETALHSFSEEVIKTYCKIDYLINNACLSRKGILSGCSYDDFNYVLRIGVSAPYMLTKLFLDFFNKGGAIVNIASTRAFMSQANTESYSAAKGGISALTHALAVSLAGKVRVNSVSPGWIDTSIRTIDESISKYSKADKNQHPAQRVGTPLDIVRAVMFLCDEENSFITGENITIDGGMTKLMIYNDDHGWQYEAP